MPPSVLLNTIDKLMIEWDPPSDDGGSPIIGYLIKMKPQSHSEYLTVYNGQHDPSTRMLTLTTFNSSALAIGAYNLQLVSYNWVGEGLPSSELTVFVISNTSPSLSSLQGTGIARFSAQDTVYVELTARAVDNSEQTSGGDHFLLKVSDYCERNPSTTFACLRVSSQHALYNRNIFNHTQLFEMTDHDNGTYTREYNSLTSGWLTTSVFLATQGGLLG